MEASSRERKKNVSPLKKLALKLPKPPRRGKSNFNSPLQEELHAHSKQQLQNNLPMLAEANRSLSGKWDEELF